MSGPGEVLAPGSGTSVPRVERDSDGARPEEASPQRAAADPSIPVIARPITTWTEALRFLGIKTIELTDLNNDGKTDDADLDRFLEAQGVDAKVSDGLTWEELNALSQKYNLSITRNAYNVVSRGGSVASVDAVSGNASGDDLVTLSDIEDFKNNVIKGLVSSLGDSNTEAVIRQQLSSSRFVIIKKGEAARRFVDQYAARSSTVTYTTLTAHTNTQLKSVMEGVVRKVLNIEGEIPPDTVITREQLGEIFMAMSFLGQIRNPENVFSIAKDIPKLDKPSTDSFLAWFTKGTTGAFEAAESAWRVGEEEGGEEAGRLNQEDMQTLRQIQIGMFSGTSAEKIQKLEEMKQKDPNNLLVRELLCQVYIETEGFENASKALENALFLREKDPGKVDYKKLVVQAVQTFAARSAGQTLSAADRALAGRARGVVAAMNFSDLVREGADPSSLKEMFLVRLDSLTREPLPGEEAYLRVMSNDSSILEAVVSATDVFATALDQAIGAEEARGSSADKEKLARLYMRAVELNIVRRDFTKVESYGTRLAEIYANLPASDFRSEVREGLKKTIDELVRFRNTDHIAIAKKILSKLNTEQVSELDIKIAMHKRGRSGLEASTEDVSISQPSDLDRFTSAIYRPLESQIAYLYTAEADKHVVMVDGAERPANPEDPGSRFKYDQQQRKTIILYAAYILKNDRAWSEWCRSAGVPERSRIGLTQRYSLLHDWYVATH